MSNNFVYAILHQAVSGHALGGFMAYAHVNAQGVLWGYPPNTLARFAKSTHLFELDSLRSTRESKAQLSSLSHHQSSITSPSHQLAMHRASSCMA